MLVVKPIIFRYFFKNSVRAFALWPFIVLKEASSLNDKTLLNHERIHIKQQIELFLILFYFIYFTEFLIRYIYLMDADAAYRKISFEQEAFTNDHNEIYLEHRKRYAMWRK
jgi:hypothetical protein